MKIDCFIFFNELDILDIRLEELYPVVDKFVIVESNLTFRGNPKPYYYEENLSRYAKYADKIVNVKLIDDNVYGGHPGDVPWAREKWQRNAIMYALPFCDPDDIIIISDADEIPRRSVVEALNPQPIQSLSLKSFYYGLNMWDGNYHTTRAARYSAITSPEEIRRLAVPPCIIEEAGWHFTYLGTPEHIANKFKSFSHQELDRPDTTDVNIIKQRMASHGDLYGDGHQYWPIDIDDSWPEAVKRDLKHWSKFIWQSD